MTAIIVGAFQTEEAEPIRRALVRGQAQPVFFETSDQAQEALARPETPATQLLFVRADMHDVDAFVAWTRTQARLFAVPVVGVVVNASDREFADAHAFGADDVVLVTDTGGFTRRAAAVESFDPQVRPPAGQGRAVIGHPDRARRLLLGRGLRQAGFDVAFAENADELLTVAKSGAPPRIVVANGELSPGNLSVIESVRMALSEPKLPVVMLQEPAVKQALLQKSIELGHVELSNEDAPPDDLVFLANELLRPDLQSVRSSSRLLYGSLCGFRPAGELRPVFGFTYNISREGVYVRTLDAPQNGERGWLELVPPAAMRAIHLRATVVWRGTQNAGSPPGFAMRIDEAATPPEDLRAYREGYEMLLGEKRGAA